MGTRQPNLLTRTSASISFILLCYLTAACGHEAAHRAATRTSTVVQGAGVTSSSTVGDMGSVDTGSPVANPLTPVAPGLWRSLSIAEAQQLLPFPLVQPKQLPDALIFESAIVTGTPPDTAVLQYNRPDINLADSAVELRESLIPQSVDVPSGGVQTTMMIGTTVITKTALTNSVGDQIVTFTWSQRNVSLLLTVPSSTRLAGSDIDQFLASTIAP